MARKEIPRELSIYINDKQVVNSLAGITSAIGKTKNELKNLNKNSATYNEDLDRLGKELQELTKHQTEFKDEIKETSGAMDESAGSFKKFRDGLVSGDLESAIEGFKGIKAELTGILKTTLAFIATPLGAALAVLSGIVIGTKALFEFNQEAEKSAVLIENLSGKTGQVVEDIRIKMKALTDTFGLSFEQLAGAVDNLVDTGAVKDEFEALEKIKNGLLTAPDKNEFIASLESSAVTAKQLGLTLDEVIALKKEIEETGVDPEATFGALQKASDKLAKQADSLRKSLTDAFGASFTDEILAKVKNGEINTVQALDAINKKSKEVNLNQTQQAQLSTELFGKAGLAAGGFAVVLDTVSGGLKKQKEELNGNQKALLELNDANEKLNKAQSELFRVRNFGEVWTKIKAEAIDALASILTYLADLKNDIQPLIDLIAVALVNGFVQLKFIVVSVFTVVGFAVKVFFDYIKFVFDFIKAFITGDFKGAFKLFGDYFTTLGNTISNFFARIKNNVIEAVQGIVKSMAPLLEAIGIDVDKLQKKLESFKSKEVVLKTTEEDKRPGKTAEQLAEERRLLQEELAKQKAIRDAARKKEEEARQKELDKKRAEQEKAAKEEMDKILALAKAKSDLAKAELNFYIANNRSKIDANKKLTPEIIAEEANRLNEIKNRQLLALDQENENRVKEAANKAKSAEELATIIETINIEYETKRIELNAQTEAQIIANKNALIEQDKQLKAEQLAADNELALMEAENKFIADQIKQEQDYQAQLAGYKKLLEDKKITEGEYLRFKDAAEKQQAEIDRQRELNKVNASLGAFGQLAGALGELFGQSKELALAQAGINGAMAITSILAAAPVGNVILDGILKGVAIGAAVISVAAQVKQITKAKAPKKPKFFYGGNTGTSPHLGHDEFGPMTGIVHDNEYVIPKSMTQNPRYANTIAWIEQERTGKRVNKFIDGGGTSPNAVPDPVMNENKSDMEMLLKAVLFRLENPIAPNLIMGYDDAKAIKDLNDEREASDQNGIVSE
jgi:hypothetical protein